MRNLIIGNFTYRKFRKKPALRHVQQVIILFLLFRQVDVPG